MKILITGSNGQLGSELREIIKNGRADIGEISEDLKKSDIIGLDIDELDISSNIAVMNTVAELKPDIIINCAAFTNVDLCEEKRTLAFCVNTLGPRNLAMAAESVDAKFVQISTDYVFSGELGKSLCEFDNADPRSVYGKTKFLGEEYVKDFSSKYFIVRTAWLYGKLGGNFVYTMMKLGKEKDRISVVNDQFGSPTSANDLAYHILKLIETQEYGVYHCVGKGQCSWYEFAVEIMKLSNRECEVNPCTTDEFPRLAKRPSYSVLENMMLESTIGNKMRDWKEALKGFMINNSKV